MSAVTLLDSAANQLRLFRRAVTHGMQQRQRWFTFVQVIADVFTQRFAIGAVVEQVVDQLEGGAQVAAIILQPFLLLWRTASQQAGTLGGCFEQTCGLTVDHTHIVLFGDVRIVHVHELKDFTFCNDVDGFRHDFQHLEWTEAGHHLEGAGVDKVANQHAGRVAKGGVGRGLATAHVGLINDVVMQERRGMNKFD